MSAYYLGQRARICPIKADISVSYYDIYNDIVAIDIWDAEEKKAVVVDTNNQHNSSFLELGLEPIH